MRLIDADALIEQLRAESRLTYLVKGAIYNQPTAYNPEAVVAELEADKTCRDRLEGYITKYKAIEIVRKGGV